jgi:hypothetical protein
MKSALRSFVFLVVITVTLAAGPTASAALPGADALAKLIIHEFDTNSDDAIDSGEWQNGIEGSFGDMDTNGDGSVESDEVNGLTEDIAEETGELAAGLIVAMIKQILLALDADGNKLVSSKEYSGLSTEIFTKLDVNKDNSLSIAELAELPVKALVQ